MSSDAAREGLRRALVSTRRALALAPRASALRGAYPEREDEPLSRLDEGAQRLAGAATRRWRARASGLHRVPGLVDAHAGELASASDAALRAASAALRVSLREGPFGDAAVARCFALARETALRTLGQRHYDVQLMGGFALLHGMVAEMEAGEGKTLTATLPAVAAALAGIPVHVVTVNDYLASRDAEAMGPVYRALGLSVGLIVSGMNPAARRAAYACDVTYCTNKEVAFDYLKDRISLEGRRSRLRLLIERLADAPGRAERLIHRGLHFAIVDEADSVLVDEARTPLIIADRREPSEEAELHRAALALARELEIGRDFAVDDRERAVRLLEGGRHRLEALGSAHGGMLSARRRREELVRQALTALHLFHRDRHYLVAEGRVQIVDEYTGRVMPDRSWEQGLHQMIEAKEEVPLTARPETRARISYQRFFRRYLRLAGMTGTAREVAAELQAIYRLPVVRIPTHRPVRRSDGGESVLASADAKWSAIAARVAELHAAGRPVLVGTRSVAASETLSERLRAAGLEHRVLNARQDREEAEIVARAGERGGITVATNMAGRGTDIRLGPGVAELGGLHVIASERHEARRIDRQLFGRTGRQGDPGSFEALVSLEDELFQVHAGPLERRLVAAAARLARSGPAAPLGAGSQTRSTQARERVVRFALSRCQRAAERLHARVRRDLLRRDRDLDALLAFSGRPE
jgi:preprotein translocase subunit SecA